MAEDTCVSEDVFSKGVKVLNGVCERCTCMCVKGTLSMQSHCLPAMHCHYVYVLYCHL